MVSVRIKAKGTTHKHCAIIDNVVSKGGMSKQFWNHYIFILELDN